MLAGYAVIFIVMVAYIASLFRRWRHLKREMEILGDMEKPS